MVLSLEWHSRTYRDFFNLSVFPITLWNTGIAFPSTLEQNAISKLEARTETIETKPIDFVTSPSSFCWQ